MTQTNYQQEYLPLRWRQGDVDPVPRQPVPEHSGAMSRWVAQVCTGIAEIAAGARPPANMHRVVTPAVLSRLRILHATAGPKGNAPIRRVTSVRLIQVTAESVEA